MSSAVRRIPIKCFECKQCRHLGLRLRVIGEVEVSEKASELEDLSSL